MSFDQRRCGRETRWREREWKAGGSRKRKRKTGGSRKCKGFPLQSPLNSEGAEGLRKFFFRLAEEVGIDEDRALPWVRGQIGSGTFRACAGPSLSRTSCKSLRVASF